METRRQELERFLPIQAAAALSVAALVGIVVWQVGQALTDGNIISAVNRTASEISERAGTPYGSMNWQAPIDELAPASAAGSNEAMEDEDGISNIAENVVGALVGSYTALSEAGSYTQEEGEKIASGIAENLRANVSYTSYSEADIQTDEDTSYKRMLTYRSDLREALEPLLKNPGYELRIFANYIESRDAEYLSQLKTAAQNYDDAVEGAAEVIVPKDATSYHVGVLNALSEFGTTIKAMTEHADDAFASAALLRTYNSAELKLFTSFNALASYEKQKQP